MKKHSLTLTKRYARALFEVALADEAGGGVERLDQVQQALAELAAFWSYSAEANNNSEIARTRDLLSDPRIPAHVVNEALNSIASTLLPNQPFFAKFLTTLSENGRLDLLSSLHQVFAAMLKEFRRALALEIISAKPLSEDQRKQISNKIVQALPPQLSKVVSFDWGHDPQLIGGMLVKSGDALLDGSVKGSLARMQQIFGVGR